MVEIIPSEALLIISSADEDAAIVIQTAESNEILLEITGIGGGGVTVHNLLSGRDVADCHPQSAITGLVAALAAKADSSALATVATSGSYTDLSNQPTIPADLTARHHLSRQ